MSNKKTPISASRIKTLQSCSWLYYSKYVLKLPDKGNLGSKLGSIAHTIFECLGNPRHRKHYTKAIKKNTVYDIEPLRLLIKKKFKKLDVEKTKTTIELLDKMILAGLNYDFFGKKIGSPTDSHSEIKFDLEVNEKDINYRILGFIDKLFLYKKKSLALIRDFKTSKKSFEGKEIEDNLQDQIYSLAVSKLYPDFLKMKVEFPFLQLMLKDGDKAVLKMKKNTKSDLKIFEYILTELQKTIDSFDEKDATSNLAFKKGYPSDGSFSGRLLCGFDNFKGHLKKDGTLRWSCPAKWSFEYYCIKDRETKNVLRTYFLDDFDKIEYDPGKEELFIEKYKGCPAWNK